MNTIVLKRATLEDSQEVAKIEKVGNSKTYSSRTKKDEIENFIKDDFVFLIKNRETTVGMVSFKITKKKIVHYNGLVIYPKFRSKGFAKKAMFLALRRVSKYSRIELVVHPHNNSAISLYFSLGFIIEAWKNNYFGDGEPRLVMLKK
ncbi:MAG: GNAT family N-acetyltransferase [Bacteroidetes bacterium]|nr:GNAT family N-acetyltransferase [Bacteroidota bacterium]